MAADEMYMGTGEVAEMFSDVLTLRQIDYLVTRGIITPDGARQGSGHRVRWSRYDVAVLAVLAPAMEMGMPAERLADLAVIARDLPERSMYWIPADGGWWVITNPNLAGAGADPDPDPDPDTYDDGGQPWLTT